jgi:uncharacterized membrane protein YdjX (TVP38/TMEM64 family)
MQNIQQAGWWGWLLFIALYALSCILFLPGSVLTLGAGAIYGFWGGTLLVSFSNVVGAVISLLISRYVARGWVARWLDQHPKFQALDAAVEREGPKIVFLSRLSPLMPFSVINYCLGLTKIPIVPFALVSWAGILPSTMVYIYIGDLAGDVATLGPAHVKENPLTWLIQGAGLIATVLVTIISTRLATKALRQRVEPTVSE